MRGFFVSSTGTGCGKTWFARGLARAAVARGLSVAALKPIETGVERDALDAIALARAALRPELARAPGLIRMRPALSPRAATLAGEAAPIEIDPLVAATRSAWAGSGAVVVEGAGGLLTPVARETTVASLARSLELPVILVVPDRLGTLSHTLAALEACRRRELVVAAVVLVAASRPDGSERENARILEEEAGVITKQFPQCADDDDVLASAAGRLNLW